LVQPFPEKGLFQQLDIISFLLCHAKSKKLGCLVLLLSWICWA